MFKKGIVWLLCLTAASLRGAAPAANPDRLGQLAPLPSIRLQTGMGLDSFDLRPGFEDPSLAPAEIRELRRQLKNDPEDPELLRDLGRLLARSGSPDEAQRVMARRVEVLRLRVARRPNDGLLLAEFGDALSRAGQPDEAGSVLRRAAQKSPEEWRVWTTLGDFLVRSSLDQVDWEASVRPSARGLPGELTAGQLSQREDLLDEGAACMDRAVALAPDVAEVYALRAVSLMWQTQSREAIDRQRGEEQDPPEGGALPKAFRVTLPDIKQAARLSETNYRAWTHAAMLEVLDARQPAGGRGGLADLPVATRGFVKTAMNHLGTMSEHPDPFVAAGALEGLTVIQLAVQLVGPETAIAQLKRAVRLDPSRFGAWELLTGFAASQPGSADELVAICGMRVTHSDTIKTRFLLVKALQKAGRLEASLAEAEDVIQSQPDSVVMQVSAAALLMQQGSDEETLTHAARHLAKARKLGAGSPATPEWIGLKYDLVLNAAVWMALSGRAEPARELVGKVLALDPANDKARAIMEQLRYWQ